MEQLTKTGKNYTKWPNNIPNCNKIDQMGVKYFRWG
jgi:hypothetical protein